jgi:ArsR family transcriptional regulator
LSIDPATLERAARVIRVLGHPLRLRILEVLEPGERNVAEIVEEVVASQAVISQQLGILRAHGIVEPRRDGARVYYRIIEPKVSRILDCIRECDLSTMPEFTPVTALTGDESTPSTASQTTRASRTSPTEADARPGAEPGDGL